MLAPRSYAQRGELERYTHWHDRLILENEQLYGTKGERNAHYLELNFTLSDGLLGLIGEVETQTQLGNTSAQKTQNILNLINQNINSERLVDTFLGVRAPLPTFKLSDLEFTPSAFYQYKLGVSFSFSNQADATDPRAQIYLKMDQKMGISTLLETSSSHQWWVSIYQLERQDFASERSAQDIAEDEKVFDLDELERTQKSLELDLRFRTELYRYISYTIGVDEVTLNQSSQHNSGFGKRPLWYQQFDYQRGDYRLYAGHHFRQRYSIADGLYMGGLWHFLEDLPLRFKTHLTTETLSLGGVLKTGSFMLQYVYQTPHQNPEDDIWAYSLHKLSVGFPF